MQHQTNDCFVVLKFAGLPDHGILTMHEEFDFFCVCVEGGGGGGRALKNSCTTMIKHLEVNLAKCMVGPKESEHVYISTMILYHGTINVVFCTTKLKYL